MHYLLGETEEKAERRDLNSREEGAKAEGGVRIFPCTPHSEKIIGKPFAFLIAFPLSGSLGLFGTFSRQ